MEEEEALRLVEIVDAMIMKTGMPACRRGPEALYLAKNATGYVSVTRDEHGAYDLLFTLMSNEDIGEWQKTWPANTPPETIADEINGMLRSL